jgi:diguanylate cyclase (GGDEF)-like protein
VRQLTASLPIFFGLFTLLSQSLGFRVWEERTGIFFGTSTHPATSLLLIMGGLGTLGLCAWPGRIATRLAGLYLFFAGAGRLAENVFGDDTFPMLNTVSLNAAFGFCLLGWAMLLMTINSRRSTVDAIILPAQALGIAAFLIGMLALTGYAYGTVPFYGIDHATPISVSAALGLMCLALGQLFAYPRQGIMRFITNPGPGGRMARLLLPASLFIPIMLGWLRLVGQSAGLYETEFGFSLFVVLDVLVLFILTFVSAKALFEADRKRLQAEEALRYRASHDYLTGLVNRAVFTDQLFRRLSLRKRRSGRAFAVFFLDLDGFKQVNDQLGHEAGDRLLCTVADMLRGQVRASDTVARLGGDEFTILLEEVESPQDAALMAERLLDHMPDYFEANGRSLPVGISIGIAVDNPDVKEPDDILRRADAALYRAKRNGKNRYEIDGEERERGVA